MEFKEVTTISTVKFLGLTNIKHSISWSEDDKIAVVTQKGVNILDLCLSRKNTTSELAFERSLIIPPSAYPTYETGIKTDEVFLRAEKDQVFQMMMDPLLYSGLKITETQPAVTLQAAWSKAGMADAQGCILALRQNTGSVVLFMSKMSIWTEVVSISQLWVKHLKENIWPQESSSGKDIYTILHSRVQQIESTGIAWSQVVEEDSSSWCLLFVAHRDGSVVAWKIEKTEGGSLNCSLSFQLNMSGMSRISHISWHAHGPHRGMLIVGDIQGVAKYVSFASLLSAAQTSHKAYEAWGEHDMIAVTGAMACAETGVWLLVVAKSSCVVALAMSLEGTQLAKTIANLGTLDISGLLSISGDSVLLMTQCGTISKIVLTYSAQQQELELECLELPSKFDTTNFNLQGLAVSRNKLIFAASQTVSVPHDHLALRESSEVIFFTYSSFESAWTYLNKQQPLSSLYKCWDYLELIRILGKNVSWELDIPALEIQSNKNPNLAWWLVIIKKLEAKEPTEQMSVIQKKLEDKILCQHASKLLSKLQSQSLDNLTIDERRSASLLRQWLINFASSNDDVHPQLLKNIAQQEILEETCDICGSQVQFCGPREARCDAGHVLPRCSLSLVQCSSVPLRSCNTCDLVTLQQPGFELEVKCIYCCRPLELCGYF